MAGWLFGSAMKSTMVTPDRALAGRDDYAYPVPERHAVLGTPLQGPWPEGAQVIYLALGCFWGAEKEMWQLPGVVTTAAGYQGGFTPYPTYADRPHRDGDGRVRPGGAAHHRAAAHVLDPA